MKNLNKKIISLALFFALGLISPTIIHAVTTPSLGQASTYGVLSSTYTDTSGATTINGDVGFTTPPATPPAGLHTNYGSLAPYATAGVDQGATLSTLALESCTFTFPAGAIDLSTDITHGPIGVYAPGVYCSTGAMNIGGPLNLSGNGTYIFRPIGALTSTVGSVINLLTNASACDVFWTPTAATTLAANTTFLGTVIADSGITVGSTVTWTGRALAFGGTVTTDTDTINVPSCVTPVPPPTPTPTSSSSDSGSSAGGFMPVYTGLGVGGYESIPSTYIPAQKQVLDVYTPSFPNTGLPPENKSFPWDIITLVGVIILVATSLGAVLKKSEDAV